MKNNNKIIISLAIILFINSTLLANKNKLDMNRILHAIHMVESGGKVYNVKSGDNGRAIGPFQIWKSYWKDATQFNKKIGGTYQDCHDYKYSLKIVRSYMRRYATQKRLKHAVTAQDIIRIHNGGPNGYKNPKTIKYYNKAKKYLLD